jgi:hypothetical protein
LYRSFFRFQCIDEDDNEDKDEGTDDSSDDDDLPPRTLPRATSLAAKQQALLDSLLEGVKNERFPSTLQRLLPLGLRLSFLKRSSKERGFEVESATALYLAIQGRFDFYDGRLNSALRAWLNKKFTLDYLT